ncbi:hypothetical protein FHX82_000830 [Amycolatopsis bartoniae]|uniref:Uncharacterized protein n=1 Tax=Amycolatopsis bartoniae TaxID=941986 RepID=A0A8H9J2H6_9PSEU|nr:hypothetical protein [Amycolatopsis bartoniae]MBB2933810.1 hypothetical protein [Amycolatopsis bartoniae]TVT10533.1 hypothetical protein FNH07_04670 [Amycolatopsis bartoniae]GHF87746.1 hypothetical protein GCM10017566_72010 [Amycolatopsis bartoniae]
MPEQRDESEDHGELERARPAEPPHVQSAPQLDPEQLRQFQQFQQFQDYLRYTEAQQRGQVVPGSGGPPVPPPGGQVQVAPPAPSPRPKVRMPRFVKRILASVLSALIFLAVLGVAGKLLYDHFFPPQDDDRPASETGGGTYHANKILSTQPYEAVRKVYQQVAQGRPDLACGYFDIPVQQKFATDLGYADCQAAVLDLKTRVTNVNDYAESLPSYVSGQQGTTITIDSCAFGVSGGPALGVFTVQQVDKGQWLITGHEPGPRTCAPPTTAASPTS